MRSLDKGGPPLDADGNAISFADYRDAAPALKKRLGRYCCFCERTVPVSLAVEHKLPKQVHPILERDWRNLLLACTNCNSCKLLKQFADVMPLWPDEHDTLRMIDYRSNGRIGAEAGLDAEDQLRVEFLLDMLGLNKAPKDTPSTDHRFEDRLEVWRLAQQSAQDLSALDSAIMRRHIVALACAKGCFSIWHRVFRGDADMIQRLTAAFPGTRQPI